MTDAPNTRISKQQSMPFTWECLLLGGKTGLIASTLYATVGLLVVESLGLGVGLFSFPAEAESWGQFVSIILAIITLILVVAIMPATIIGAMTGMCFGQFTKLIGETMPRQLFLALCVAFCLVVVILFHVWLEIPITLSYQSSSSAYSFDTYASYPFFIGIPSVIYVLIGIWFGWKVYSRVGILRDHQT